MTTERDLLDLLHKRYNKVYVNGRRYVVGEHVKDRAGHYTQAILDAVVLDVWPSSGLVAYGFEVKTSRGDYLREIRRPDKAAAFTPYLDYFWIIAATRDVVRDDLPDGWGLLVKSGPRLVTVKQGRRNRERQEMPRAMQFSLARSIAKTAERHTP